MFEYNLIQANTTLLTEDDVDSMIISLRHVRFLFTIYRVLELTEIRTLGNNEKAQVNLILYIWKSSTAAT